MCKRTYKCTCIYVCKEKVTQITNVQVMNMKGFIGERETTDKCGNKSEVKVKLFFSYVHEVKLHTYVTCTK